MYVNARLVGKQLAEHVFLGNARHTSCPGLNDRHGLHQGGQLSDQGNAAPHSMSSSIAFLSVTCLSSQD